MNRRREYEENKLINKIGDELNNITSIDYDHINYTKKTIQIPTNIYREDNRSIKIANYIAENKKGEFKFFLGVDKGYIILPRKKFYLTLKQSAWLLIISSVIMLLFFFSGYSYEWLSFLKGLMGVARVATA